MTEHGGGAYIMSSHSRCLYVGVTSDVHDLKGWSRARKITPIDKINPGWDDLTPSFSHQGPSTPARSA